MTKKVLIVTNSSDLHADLSVATLLAKGHSPFRLDLDKFPRDYQVCQAISSGKVSNTIRRLPGGEWLDLDEVGAIWVRKPAEFTYLSEDLSLQERAFAKLETEQALFSQLYTLDCYWMSHPVALRNAQWKGEQLMRAMQMGFRVPASIVTNSPEQVRAFREAIPGRMIFKAMSTPTLAAEELDKEDCVAGGLATTIVDEDMMEDLEAVSELPCHFQEYIPKQYELRVTVIGERVFAAKIHSQDDERTTIDSRNMSADIPYEACALPPELEQRCLQFVHSYGLNYGALDLIVTPDEEVVFLENNPSGQFLYVEQLIPELGMFDALADKLIGEAQCRS
jgi:glutathione synthase/RimK-type ligase-like ATP-grasp enzyme